MSLPRVLVLSQERCGSTALCEYLRSNPKIEFPRPLEVLNADVQLPDEASQQLWPLLNNKIEAPRKSSTILLGIKLFPSHLIWRQLHLDELVYRLQITHIIVLWRKNVLETMVSAKLAYKTGLWYSNEEPRSIDSVTLERHEIESQLYDLKRQWKTAFAEWPLGITPHFIAYEDFVKQPKETLAEILEIFQIEVCGWEQTFAKRQNPAPLSQKLQNWNDLAEDLRNVSINVPEEFQAALERRFCAANTETEKTQRYNEIVSNLESYLRTSERWDDGQARMNEVTKFLECHNEFSGDLLPYIEYIECQSRHELPTASKWLHTDLAANKEYEATKNVPQLIENETLQLCCWLIAEHKATRILDLGDSFGHRTSMFLSSAQNACPTEKPALHQVSDFVLQADMLPVLSGALKELKQGESYFQVFKEMTSAYDASIKPISWQNNTGIADHLLATVAEIDFVFFAFNEYRFPEQTILWQQLLPRLTSGKTVIVVSGISRFALPLLTQNSIYLTPIAKCTTSNAKAFLYQRDPPEAVDYSQFPTTLPRKLCFVGGPNWSEHHLNAFEQLVDALKEQFHQDSAKVLFIAAVGQYICDHPDASPKPWIGIVHAVPSCPEQYYVPDMLELCTERYRDWLASCKGMFTMTAFQRDFLLEKLRPMGYRFPISPIKYPLVQPEIIVESHVVQRLKQGELVDLVFIGSNVRDYKFFFDCSIPKTMRKLMLVSDEAAETWTQLASADVQIRPRVSSEEYESILRSSVPLLSLKHEGGANTLILECIARNIPILAPNLSSITEYIGEDYPLLYNFGEPDLRPWLTVELLQKAIDYLEAMDKTSLSIEHVCESMAESTVMKSIPPYYEDQKILEVPVLTQFDVTLSICSFKRTHHLDNIVERLWRQDYQGSMEIVIWNNNPARAKTVNAIAEKYQQRNTPFRSLEVINSSENHVCVIRFAMAPLMRSEELLVIDDDVIPEAGFVRFFMEARKKHPRDVLCVRGHVFLPHELEMTTPEQVWHDYEYLRFFDDYRPERLIHFAHVCACLIPKQALHECAAHAMPQPDFALVDDYWMSYILNSKYDRNLRKLSIADAESTLYHRGSELDRKPVATDARDAATVKLLEHADDSETPGLAMHTRAEVVDARLRMYIHHMLDGWPKWPKTPEMSPEITEAKTGAWEKRFLGFNISSYISDGDLDNLWNLGVRWVRIGCMKPIVNIDIDFLDLRSHPAKELARMENLFKRLAKRDTKVVVTLHRELATEEIWVQVARLCAPLSNVVGYDLINEPFIEEDLSTHYVSMTDEEHQLTMGNTLQKYYELIRAIRTVDKATRIIVEPTFWAHYDALPRLVREICELREVDENVMASYHFYGPRRLTWNTINKGRFGFPGNIPVYQNPKGDTEYWDADKVHSKIKANCDVARTQKLPIIVGEMGISRTTRGAEEYLAVLLESCRKLNVSAFLYAFRDPSWDAMNYELGTQVGAHGSLATERNRLVDLIKKEVQIACTEM